MANFTAGEALEIAMEIEKNGEVFYTRAAEKASDPQVKELFEALAIQEQRHYQAFLGMVGKHVTDAPSLATTEYDEYRVYLQAMLQSDLFAGPDKALAIAEQAQDRQTALQAAVGFEKDTLLFFYDLREMVSEADREKVGDIIREEKAHLQRLAKML